MIGTIYCRRYLAFSYEGQEKNFCATCPDFPGLVTIASGRDEALLLLEQECEKIADLDVPVVEDCYIPDFPGIRVHLIIVEVEEK